MTEETPEWSIENLSPEQREKYVSARDAAHPDAMLGVLSSINGIPLTLTVGGSLVSGRSSKRLEWLDGLIKSTGDSGSFLKLWRDDWESVQKALDEPPVDGELPPIEHFIYLTDCRWYGSASGPIPSTEGVFWRGRLSEVQGWSFGQMGVIRPNDV